MTSPFLVSPIPGATEELPLSEHYEILHAIGRGAFGLVYLARDRAGHQVAIKEFPVSPAVAQGFFRELSIVFGLNHPNIVRCLNLFYSHRGRNFLIFEYVPGGTLRDLLERRGSLPPAEALPLLRELCLGLEHAHGREIVHRDLKPENILLSPGENGALTPKIADLGLAQSLGSVRRADLGGDGSGDGSPAYMAPEQFYDQVTPASDLYALGVLFYELLVGRRPFEGLPSRLLLAHLHEPPDLAAIVHPGCRTLVGDLLAKQPGCRPASAGAVLARLEDLGHGEDCPVEIVTPTAPAVPCPARAELMALLSEGCVWQSAGPARVWNFQTSSGLHVPAPHREVRALLAHAHCTDSFEPERDRLIPGFLTEEVRAVHFPDAAGAASDAPSLLATRRSVREYDPRAERARTLFAHGVAALQAFVADPGRDRYYLADRQNVFALDAHGRSLWNRANGNYAVEPQLCVLADGRLAATTGPAAPALRVFGPEGEEQVRVSLPAPAVALRSLPAAADGDGRSSVHFQVVLIGLGSEEPARLLTFVGDRIASETELGDGLFAARWQWGGVLSLWFRDNRVSWRAPDGRELWSYQAPGAVLGDCWLPSGGCILLLEDAPARGGRVARLQPVKWAPAEAGQPRAQDADFLHA